MPIAVNITPDKGLGAARHLVLHEARHAMDAQGESHLLEHVAVVDAGLVKAERHAHAGGVQRVERRDAAAQAEIRAAIATDGCAWLVALFNPSIR